MTITANFTGLEKQTTLSNPVERYCAPELAEGIQHPLVCLIVLNIFLSICAFLGNSIILVALHKKLSLHTPSKLLLRCLSASDLCVGLIAEPAIVVYWTSLVFEGNTTCRCQHVALLGPLLWFSTACRWTFCCKACRRQLEYERSVGETQGVVKCFCLHFWSALSAS